MNQCFPGLLILFAILGADTARLAAGDWPMWRRDAGRTAVSPDAIPENLTLRWTRHLPPLEPAFHSVRLQFDAGYEPIISNGLVIVGSSRNDSVTAYDAATGAQRWRIFAGGPVRFAPAVWKDRVFFGSDDGHLYCVRREDGKLLRRFQAVPSSRRVLGNRRMISVWPVRGGPVVADDRVYFAAGVWPMEGVFVYCLDADTGQVLWLNDRLGHRYGQHPHGTQAIGGLAPQGYLVVNGEELLVPCSTAYPARLNRDTGELIEFQLPAPGRFPGGWFAALDPKTARDIRRGRLTFDDVVNRQQHEDKEHRGDGDSGISRLIRAGTRELKFDDGYPGVDGTVHTMLTAEGRLLVVTREGTLYCFDDPASFDSPPHVYGTPPDSADRKTAPRRRGYSLVAGLSDGEQVRGLLRQNSQVVVVESDPEVVFQFRQEFDRAGLYGTRVAIIESALTDSGLPPYFADMILTEEPEEFTAALAAGVKNGNGLLESLRPFGGMATLTATEDQRLRLKPVFSLARREGFQVSSQNGQIIVRRDGPLRGSTDYRGGWQESRDQRVRFPLGVLWFDDTLGHFKRSPQPQFIEGVMVSFGKDWQVPMIKGLRGKDYPLNEAELSDVYTGRIFGPDEVTALRAALDKPDRNNREPSQYRPPYQKNDWKPEQPRPGRRINPLTGEEEIRSFPKTYGCDGGVDYGDFFTMRSGTAAFYDKTRESGTVFISGPRSGCTNSVIPANGLLNVPYYYEGCTCSYPLPVALSLVSMPESYEQWSSWGAGQPQNIQRIGINFGAPGDRTTHDGTLWLDYPSIGGPSPAIETATSPQEPRFRYRHSLFIRGGEGWPWIVASSAEGLNEFTLKNLKPGRYTVRLFFAETGDAMPGERTQTIALQGREVEQGLDIVKQSGGPLRGLVREFTDVNVSGFLQLNLIAERGKTLISGIEIIATGLKKAGIPTTE